MLNCIAGSVGITSRNKNVIYPKITKIFIWPAYSFAFPYGLTSFAYWTIEAVYLTVCLGKQHKRIVFSCRDEWTGSVNLLKPGGKTIALLTRETR